MRKAVDIESGFGVRLECPLDEFNAARHVANDSAPSTKAPPTPERLEEFFAFLKDRVATARKFAPAARDYALFRTLYHGGLRAEEAASLELWICTSVGARSGSYMSASAREPRHRVHGPGGFPCWTVWT